MKELKLSRIVSNLESLFSNLNDKFYNGELQTPVITITPNSSRGATAYGWCTCYKVWKESDGLKSVEYSLNTIDSSGYYEINICADYLNRTFEETATTLLHEMVHLYNSQMGIIDTSRGNTYHNKRFKETAEQHGLVIDCVPTYGYTKTSLNEEAREFINNYPIKDINLFRLNSKEMGIKSKQSTRKLVCPKCNNIIRATKKDIRVICGDCLVYFIEAR